MQFVYETEVTELLLNCNQSSATCSSIVQAY